MANDTLAARRFGAPRGVSRYVPSHIATSDRKMRIFLPLPDSMGIPAVFARPECYAWGCQVNISCQGPLKTLANFHNLT